MSKIDVMNIEDFVNANISILKNKGQTESKVEELINDLKSVGVDEAIDLEDLEEAEVNRGLTGDSGKVFFDWSIITVLRSILKSRIQEETRVKQEQAAAEWRKNNPAMYEVMKSEHPLLDLNTTVNRGGGGKRRKKSKKKRYRKSSKNRKKKGKSKRKSSKRKRSKTRRIRR